MAHYTDSSLRPFIDYLRSRPDFDRTLVVITGDHEALGARRDELLAGSRGRVEVGEEAFVPFIMLNSPRGGVDSTVIGQIDIYPTLLAAMDLWEYQWHGMGHNALSAPTGMAISSMTRAEVGDTASVSPERLDNMRRARDVSDKIIRKDYFNGVF